MTLTRLATAAALAAAALVAQTPAHAVGRLIDVNVIDRDTGARLPVYRHNGDWWVAGRPGARYGVQLRNAGGERLLGVVSVDGVNVVTGDTASFDQAGYVLSRWQATQITGWRKNEAEVAAFNFTALPRSYAARTGRPDNVGVIGVAVFRERYRAPVRPQPPYPRNPGYPDYPPQYPEYPAYPTTRESPAAAPQGAPADEAREASPQAKSAPASPQLGTGHGQRETSYSSTTQFERRSYQPDEVITIRYDSRDNLVAMGIIPHYPARPQRPDAFPEAPDAGYVPDPPRWR